jgi:hypothetical protein
MINLGRLSGAMFAAALLLCAFPDAIAGQEKTPPPNALTELAAIELNVEKLRTELDAFKRDLGNRIKDIEQKLVDQQKYVQRSPESDGKTGDGDLQSCCRHINHSVPCCGYVYHHEPCCRHTYYPRRVYHPDRYAHHPTPCRVAAYDPEPW